MQYLEVKNYDFNRQLSPSFKLGELIRSNTAYNQKLYVQYMNNDEIVQNLKFLCDSLLQPIRDQLKRPIVITSGYRCSALNSLIGGAKNSLHLHGYAADIRCNGAMLELAHVIQTLRFHECLIHDSYIHVSIKPMYNELRYRNLTNDRRFDFP